MKRIVLTKEVLAEAIGSLMSRKHVPVAVVFNPCLYATLTYAEDTFLKAWELTKIHGLGIEGKVYGVKFYTRRFVDNNVIYVTDADKPELKYLENKKHSVKFVIEER